MRQKIEKGKAHQKPNTFFLFLVHDPFLAQEDLDIVETAVHDIPDVQLHNKGLLRIMLWLQSLQNYMSRSIFVHLWFPWKSQLNNLGGTHLHIPQ